jgi:hypothetical protein
VSGQEDIHYESFTRTPFHLITVTPAKAGVQLSLPGHKHWIPAFAGMTGEEERMSLGCRHRID